MGGQLLSGGVLTIADADLTLVGTTLGEALGNTFRTCPDVDGDSLPDLWVGAPGWGDGSNGYGRAYLFGSTQMQGASELLSSEAYANFTGDWEFGEFGYSLAGLPDLDGDGLGESALAARGGDGVVYVLLGSTIQGGGSFGPADADWTITGSSADGFGEEMAVMDDADGDSLSDLLVVGPYSATRILRGATILAGGPSPLSNTLPQVLTPGFLSHVGPSGDVNADGVSDILVGQTGWGAYVGNPPHRLYQGLACIGFGGPWLSSASAVLDLSSSGFCWAGAAPGASFGSGPTALGDLDGDGDADLVVGSANASPNGLASAGEVHIFLSPY